jgi:hypothetical protein
MPAGLDPDLEAISLMTMSAGLGTSVLADHSSPEQAQAVIDYHLNRLFPTYSHRLSRARSSPPTADPRGRRPRAGRSRRDRPGSGT